MPPSSEHLEMLAELMDAPALQRNVWGAPARPIELPWMPDDARQQPKWTLGGEPA